MAPSQHCSPHFRSAGRQPGRAGRPRYPLFDRALLNAGTVLVLALAVIRPGPARAQTNFTIETAQEVAAKGNADALYFLARHYAKGEGVTRDHTNAAIYMRKAADAGNAAAQNDLGAYYARGFGVEQDFQQAAKWYRKAAENGDPLAQYSLGKAYSEGRGIETNQQESIQWFEKSAEQKQPEAMLALGDVYLRGREGVPIDCRVAARWFRKALEFGRAAALNSLGAIYERGGGGVEQDVQQAVACYREAAEKGDARGQMNLGRMYFDGVGVQSDFAEAYKWFYLGSKNGDRIAQHYLDELTGNNILPSARPTPEQIAAAIGQANEIDRQIKRKKAPNK